MQIAGIDADSIVSQLIEIERIPLTQLESRKERAQSASNAIAEIRSEVDAFHLAAERLSTSSGFRRFSSTVSNTDAVAATISGTAAPAHLSFTVDQLAQAHGLRSVGTLAGPALQVTSQALIAVGAGTRAVGVATVRAGAGIAAGDYTLSVTQAATSASRSGSSPLAASTIIDGTNHELALDVNGTTQTVIIAKGTYDAEGLAAAVQDALDAGGLAASASIDGSGALRLSTDRVGSGASIEVQTAAQFDARGVLGLDVGTSTGTDGVIDVDGTTTTIASVDPGDTVAVDTGAGTLDVTLSGDLEVGDTTISVVSTGDRSLTAVAAAITGANRGVTAAAVQVADDQWRLQLSATSTGVDGQIAIDTTVFDGVGGMVESSTARNAEITVGAGAGAYQIEASGNTFTNVLPGVTLTAKQVTTAAIDVSVARDDTGLAADVRNMVKKLNTVLASIKVQTRFDVDTRTSGLLSGESTIRRLADTLRDALGDRIDGLALTLPSQVGIERNRDGTFRFDDATFLAAMADDPTAVERLFVRGGTDTGQVRFSDATVATTAGSYDVEVTTPATRAVTARLFDGGAAADATVGVRIGDVTATIGVTNGESADDIIDRLNTALANADLDIIAEADATGVLLRAGEYGADGDFEVNLDVAGAGTWDAYAGQDIEGTIDGVAATGRGNELRLDSDTSPAEGLRVVVDEGVSGALGSVDYLPGIAGRVAAVTDALTRIDTGTLTTAEEAADNRIEEFNDQIERLEDRLTVRELNLRRQWANFQTVLSGLQSQQTWLASQLGILG